MTSFHKSNLGQFGESLPCDMDGYVDGYVHMTAAGWMSAPIDFGSETLSTEELQEWAEEKAAEAVEATEKAEAALAEWQVAN